MASGRILGDTEQGAAIRIIEVLLVHGGLGAAIALGALGIAFYFHRLAAAREAEMRTLQEKRLEDVRAQTAAIERANAAMQTAAALSEARDATIRQLVEVVTAMKLSIDAHRDMASRAVDRIERALDEIRKQR